MNALKPLVTAVPPVRSRRGPRRRRPAKLHADKGYDYPELRSWLSRRGTIPRIARRGIESSERLGRYRWVVERTLAWIARHRRCVRDYERLPAHHEAMVRWSMIRITSRRLAKKV